MRTTYRVRVHINFMQQVLDRNMEMFLNHVDNLVNKTDFYELPGLSGIKLTDLDLRLGVPPMPVDEIDEESDFVSETASITSDLFTDREEIIMEIEGMQLRGTARLVADDEPDDKGFVEILAPLELSQFVFWPTQVLGGNETADNGDYLGEPGFLYPKLNVEDVALKMNVEETVVTIKDSNVPLYRSNEF